MALPDIIRVKIILRSAPKLPNRAGGKIDGSEISIAKTFFIIKIILIKKSFRFQVFIDFLKLNQPTRFDLEVYHQL